MRDLGVEWTACMRRGDFEGAWRIDGAVLAGRDPASRDDPGLPYHLRWVWDGRPFDGAHVLVRCYHGLGDTLQFARFLPLLRARAATITLECQPSLVSLLSRPGWVDRVVPFDVAAPRPPAECDLEIMELSHALRAAPQAAPAPYLAVHPASLPAGTLGFCSGTSGWDPARSVDPSLFDPLTRAPRVTLMDRPTTLDCLNPAGCSSDVAATAALIAGCAIVVTVDTMVAHLAGALGRPTALLLKHDADWRWMADRADSPWYPSMRLYRQPSPGDWASVMADVVADVAAGNVAAKG